MSLTTANSIIMLAIPNVYTTPQQIQGYSAEDVFDTDALEVGETMPGVDGRLSGGWVYNPVTQNFTLQADSASNEVFDTWWQAEVTIRDKYPASAVITLPSISKKYVMTNGFLITVPPIAGVKKLLQPRRFTIRWESIVPQNTLIS